jgi:hypothetical protein
MYLYNVTLKNLDAKNLHRQIMQLEALQADMMLADSEEADALKDTVRLLHEIEESLREQGRLQHHHH